MLPITFSAVYLPLLLSSLALVICIIFYIFFKSYIKRRTSREWIIQEGILTEIREEVNALLKSLDETTDRDITLITEREKNLRALLAEVDKRFKVYVRELEKRPVAQAAYEELLASSPAKAANNGTYLDLGKLRYSLKSKEAAAVNVAANATDSAAVSAAAAGPAAVAFVPAFEPPQTPEPKKAESGTDAKAASAPSVSSQVHSMLKEGFPKPAIASRLGLSIAEVEFTAALLERRDVI